MMKNYFQNNSQITLRMIYNFELTIGRFSFVIRTTLFLFLFLKKSSKFYETCNGLKFIYILIIQNSNFS